VLGLHFDAARTPWGIAYTVAGARSELDDLTALLRDALGAPDMPDTEFERRRRMLWEDVLRTTETPAARILTELRVRAAPGHPAIDGTPTTLERMTRVTLRDVWARTHRPEAMTVVVSGDISDDELRGAFQDLGASSGAAGSRGTPSLQGGAGRGTQVFRHWYGQGFRVADPADPHGAVVALLASDRLRGTPAPFEAEVQLIQLENVQLLAVLAAAYSGDAAAMRERMPRLLANTRESLSADLVRSAVLRVRQELLQQARTPQGLVSVVGRHLDATREPTGAVRFLDGLDRVSLQSTNAFISELERQPPMRAEVRP
jgi:predicted Zn-dependent peptidase